MNKYIDAEQLIELVKEWRDKQMGYAWAAVNKVLKIIASLQQEQPKFKVGDTIHKKGENTVFPMVIERISDGDYVCDNAHSFINIKYQDDYELVQQEQPEVDLEKLGEIARHIIAVKQNVEDMRLSEDEWLLLERLGYPQKLNARNEDQGKC